jgi:hypothetical protein
MLLCFAVLISTYPRLFALIVVAAFAGPAWAGPTVESTAIRDTSQLAEDLGILHDQTSALLILATGPYDHVLLGLEGAEGTTRVVCEDGAPEPGTIALGIDCIRAVAHPLEPGHLDVSVQRGEDSWSGALLMVAGDVGILDVEALLRLAARARATEAPTFAFDILAFYDKLAARKSKDKAGYCRRVLAGMPDGEDRALVQEACDRAAARVASEATAEEEDLADDLELEDGLDEPEVDPSFTLLYHPDGRPRLVPRGTVPRRIATIGALSGVAVAVGGALGWEVAAERTYLDFRKAERIGDDPAMTEALFFTKQNDLNRDAAIGVGIGLTVTAFAFLAHQLLERKAFLRAKATAEAEAKLKGAD